MRCETIVLRARFRAFSEAQNRALQRTSPKLKGSASHQRTRQRSKRAGSFIAYGPAIEKPLAFAVAARARRFVSTPSAIAICHELKGKRLPFCRGVGGAGEQRGAQARRGRCEGAVARRPGAHAAGPSSICAALRGELCHGGGKRAGIELVQREIDQLVREDLHRPWATVPHRCQTCDKAAQIEFALAAETPGAR